MHPQGIEGRYEVNRYTYVPGALIPLLQLRQQVARCSAAPTFEVMFDESQLTVEPDDSLPYVPLIKLRSQAQNRIDKSYQRDQDHEQSAGKHREPEGQVVLQEGDAGLVELLRVLGERQITALRSWEPPELLENVR